MADIAILKTRIEKLRDLAVARKTNQGLVVYDAILKRLNDPLTEVEVDELFDLLKKSLSGIEAHGYFTEVEFEVVTEIRNM